MTILSAQSIRKFAEDERSIITPFSPVKQIINGKSYGLSSCGYDVRIAEDLIVRGHSRISHTPVMVLGSTIEHFNMPVNIVGMVHDKSSWARKGLAVQNTVIEPGWRGYLTVELTNHARDDISLQAGDPIAQIIFHWLDDNTVMPYNGKYQDQPAGPQEAIEEKST